jgi:hypothetical protein
MSVMNADLTIESIAVADPPDAWADAGFTVERDRCRVGTIDLHLLGSDAGRGLVAMSVRNLGEPDPDGLPAKPASPGHPPPAASAHPNGAIRIDHVVVFTPNRARTSDALQAAGLDLRRLRDEPTPAGGGFQAFFRLGEAILEVIENPKAKDPEGPARLWGLAFLVDSLETTAEVLGDRLSEPRPAVQPGRQIATLRREAGLSFGCAFMTPGREAA